MGDAELSLSEYAKDGLILIAGVILLAIGWRPEFFDGQTSAVIAAGLMLVGYAVRGLTDTTPAPVINAQSPPSPPA